MATIGELQILIEVKDKATAAINSVKSNFESISRGAQKAVDDVNNSIKSINNGLNNSLKKDRSIKITTDIADFELKLKEARKQLGVFKIAGDRDGMVKVMLNIEDLKSNISSAKKELKGLSSSSTNNQIANSLSKIRNQGEPVLKLFDDIKARATAIVGTTAVAWLGKEMVTLAGNLEQTRVAFETLTGSVDKANKMIQDLANFAKATPFELTGLEQTAKTMMGMGFEAEQVIPILKILGDSVSAIGGSQDTLNGVILAISQIKTKGRLSMEEMNQLAERGLPVYDILKQKLGLTQKEFEKLGSNGISAGKAISAILEGLNERYDGMMDSQSKTFNGMLSNLKDSMDLTLRELGSNILPQLKKNLDEFLDRWNQWGATITQSITSSFLTGFEFIEKGLSGLGEIFNLFYDGISQMGDQYQIRNQNGRAKFFWWIDLGLQSLLMSFQNLGGEMALIIEKMWYNVQIFVDKFIILIPKAWKYIAAFFDWVSDYMLESLQAPLKSFEDRVNNIFKGLNNSIGTNFKEINISVDFTAKSFDKAVSSMDKWFPEIQEINDEIVNLQDKKSWAINKIMDENTTQLDVNLSKIEDIRARYAGSLMVDNNVVNKSFSLSNDRLKKLFESLNKGLNGASSDVSKRVKEITAGLNDLLKLQKDVVSIGLAETMAKPLDDVKKEISNISTWILNTMKNIKNLSKDQIDDIKDKISESIQAVKDEWKKSIESIENYISSVGDSLKKQMDSIDDTKSKIKELSDAWISVKKDALQQIAEIRLSLQQSISEIESNQTNSLVDRFAEVLKSISSLQEDISNSSADQLKTQKELLQVEKDIAEAKKDLSDAENKMNDATVQKLQKRIQQEKDVYSTLPADQKAVQETVINSLQSQLDEYKKNAQEDIDNAQSKLSDLNDKKSDLQTNSELADKQKQLNDLVAEKIQLEKLLSSAQEERAKTLSQENETEKILREAKEKRVEAEQQAQEKISILEATANSNGINNLKLKVQEEDGILKTYYQDRQGKWHEVLSSENQDLVLQTATKVNQYKTDLANYIDTLKKQVKGTDLVISNLRASRSQYYSDISQNAKTSVDNVLQQYNRMINEMKRATPKLQFSLGFAGGGYTGSGGVLEPAGIVHKGEYVVPNWMVKTFGGLMQSLESVRTRGFANGGFTSAINFGDVIVNNRQDADYLASQIENILVRKFRANGNFI